MLIQNSGTVKWRDNIQSWVYFCYSTNMRIFLKRHATLSSKTFATRWWSRHYLDVCDTLVYICMFGWHFEALIWAIKVVNLQRGGQSKVYSTCARSIDNLWHTRGYPQFSLVLVIYLCISSPGCPLPDDAHTLATSSAAYSPRAPSCPSSPLKQPFAFYT